MASYIQDIRVLQQTEIGAKSQKTYHCTKNKMDLFTLGERCRVHYSVGTYMKYYGKLNEKSYGRSGKLAKRLEILHVRGMAGMFELV